MKSLFNKKFNLILEEISTIRKSIQKIDQLSYKEFIRFLKEFLPYVKNGKVDLKDVKITEKIDGVAIRLLTKNGKMMFESSYSGITEWNKVPFKEAAYFLYQTYSQLFNDIYELIGSDFKIIGELIWIDDLEDSGKVTPVCASYLTNKFGKHGGIVVFDILRISGDELIPFEDNEFYKSYTKDDIINMIKDLDNDEFSFYLNESINITDNVTFLLNPDDILAKLENPEYSKERFSKIKDASILAELDKIKEDICEQLEETIRTTKGAFSEEGDLIEGIVVKINSSGNQYGIFSNGYKQLKEIYWKKYNEIELLYEEFFKQVFGCTPRIKKRVLYPMLEKDFMQFENLFNINRPIYLEKIKEAYIQLLEYPDIPHATKKIQISMAEKALNALSEISYTKFIKKFVFYITE